MTLHIYDKFQHTSRYFRHQRKTDMRVLLFIHSFIHLLIILHIHCLYFILLQVQGLYVFAIIFGASETRLIVSWS